MKDGSGVSVVPLVQLMALPEEQQLETLQNYMLAQAAEAAGIDDLDPDQPLLALGLDSLRAAEFAVQVAVFPRVILPSSLTVCRACLLVCSSWGATFLILTLQVSNGHVCNSMLMERYAFACQKGD